MPRYNQSRYPGRWKAFERLPRKLQVFLLILLMLAAAVLSFVVGIHCLRTGKPIVMNNSSITFLDCFLCSAACLAIAAGLLAVWMGWAKSSQTEF